MPPQPSLDQGSLRPITSLNRDVIYQYCPRGLAFRTSNRCFLGVIHRSCSCSYLALCDTGSTLNSLWLKFLTRPIFAAESQFLELGFRQRLPQYDGFFHIRAWSDFVVFAVARILDLGDDAHLERSNVLDGAGYSNKREF